MVTTDPRFSSRILGLMLALATALMVLSGAVTSARAFTVSPADVFINEIHSPSPVKVLPRWQSSRATGRPGSLI